MTNTSPSIVVDIQPLHDGSVRLSVEHPAPVPPYFRSALSLPESTFFQDGLDVTGWESVESDESLTQTRSVLGPWALDVSLIWAMSMLQQLPLALAAFGEGAAGKKLPFVVRCNGHTLTSREDIEAALMREMPMSSHALGEFTLSQPELRVTDPCYETVNYAPLQALPGRWRAHTLIGPTDWNARVHVLQVSHDSLGAQEVLPWQELEATKICAGVDSGQCGFFDNALYPTDAAEFEWEAGRFYGYCCDATLNYGLPGGTVIQDKGAVARSGFGDGGYAVYIRRDEQGRVVLAQLVFIGDEEPEEGD